MLGGSGAWPTAGQGCSGYLVEHDDYRLFLDPGYATLPRLLELYGAHQVDAVLVSHGHPDHCADLNPLLRARALSPSPPTALPVHAPTGALDPVLALDRPGMLQHAYRLNEFTPGESFGIGPFTVDSWLLPHFVPNAGLRLSAGGRSVAYTGCTGPSPDLVPLARGTDLFLAEATYPDHVPTDDYRYLTSARQAGKYAARAGTGHLHPSLAGNRHRGQPRLRQAGFPWPPRHRRSRHLGRPRRFTLTPAHLVVRVGDGAGELPPS